MKQDYKQDNGWAVAKAALDQELECMIGDRGTQVPGLAVIAYKEGQEVYSCFLGSRRRGDSLGQEFPMTRDSRFRIASVSKQFTVFTLLQLAEQQKIDLDEEAGRYLGFRLRHPLFPHVPITVRMLANHTSSLRDGRVYSIPPQDSVQEFFREQGKYYEGGAHFASGQQPPGEYFAYCNLNYGLLGTIIESVTGERFDIYQQSHILRQLDIQGGYVPGNFSPQEFAKLGTVYQKKDPEGKWDEQGIWYGKADDFQGIQPPRETIALQNPYAENQQADYLLLDYVPGTNATMFSPTGGLRISCGELAHALEMLMNQGIYRGKTVLSPSAVRKMFQWQWVYDPAKDNGDTCGGTLLAYGLGEYPMDGGSTARLCRDARIDLVGHAGEAFGLRSLLCFRPGTRDGFVFIMNGEAIEEGKDRRSMGRFSGNCIWEERVADAVCRNVFGAAGND